MKRVKQQIFSGQNSRRIKFSSHCQASTHSPFSDPHPPGWLLKLCPNEAISQRSRGQQWWRNGTQRHNGGKDPLWSCYWILFMNTVLPRSLRLQHRFVVAVTCDFCSLHDFSGMRYRQLATIPFYCAQDSQIAVF